MENGSERSHLTVYMEQPILCVAITVIHHSALYSIVLNIFLVLIESLETKVIGRSIYPGLANSAEFEEAHHIREHYKNLKHE